MLKESFMEVHETRNLRSSCENAISKAINTEQTPSSACFRHRTCSENSKSYLHSGMTPRLNDTHSRSRHRSSINQNVSSIKSKGPLVQNSKTKESELHKAASKQNQPSPQEMSIDAEARERRQRVLTSAHRRWRSSDRLNPRIISKDFQESKSSFFQKRVLQITGSKQKLYSEPTVDTSKDKLCSAEGYAQTNCPSIISDLDSIIKSENEYQSDSNPRGTAEQCEALLSGHPFILQDTDIDHSHVCINVRTKSPRESYDSSSHCESKDLNAVPYSKENNDGRKRISIYVHGDNNTSTREEAETKSVNSKSSEMNMKEMAILASDLNSPDVAGSVPPKVAKCAWGVAVPKEREASEETLSDITTNIDPNICLPPEAQMRPVRHWANIEHRAATRNAALFNSTRHPDPPSAPLVKSKSTWRIHAAKARESVAGLLNFTKTKETSSTSASQARRLKADCKFHPHHKSSPCLNTSLLQDDAQIYSNSSKQTSSRRGIDKQTSSPELFESQHKNGARLQESISHKEEKESLSANEDRTQLMNDRVSIKNKEDSNISGAYPSTSLTNHKNEIHLNRKDLSDLPQSPEDKSESNKLQLYSTHKGLSATESYISEDKYEGIHYKPTFMSEKASKNADPPPLHVLHEGHSQDSMYKEKCIMETPGSTSILFCRSQSRSSLLEDSNEETNVNSEHAVLSKSSDGLMQTLRAAPHHLSKLNLTDQDSSEECLLSKKDEAAINNNSEKQILFGMQSDSDNCDIEMTDDIRHCVNVEEMVMKLEISYEGVEDNVIDVQNLTKEQDKGQYDTMTNSAKYTQAESKIADCLDSEISLMIRTTGGNNQKTSPVSNNEKAPLSCTKDMLARSHNVEEDTVRNDVVTILADLDNPCKSELCVSIKETDETSKRDGISTAKSQGHEIQQRNGFDSIAVDKAKPEHTGSEREVKPSSFSENEVKNLGCAKNLESVRAHIGDFVDSKTNKGGEHQDTLCDSAGSNSLKTSVHEIQNQRHESTSSVSSSKHPTRGRKGSNRGAGEDGGGGKRERSRRVEDMLNNQVFQKHLAKHADTIERRVFGTGKKGMRKALSNFDLSTDQSDMLGDVMSSIFNYESSFSNNNDSSTDIDSFDKCVIEEDNSLHKVSRCVSLCEKSSDSMLNNAAPHAEDTAPITTESFNKRGRLLRKAASSFLLRSFPKKDPDFLGANTDRRMSSVCPCDDQKLLKDFHNMHNKRRRMHIPSFTEYKQKKQFNYEAGYSLDPENYGQNVPIDGIYVIEESEQDGEVHRMNVESSTDSENTNKSNSIRNSEDYMKGNQGQVAIFSHPAIVITTEHCSQLKNSLWSGETRSSRRKRNTENRARGTSSKQEERPTSPKADGEASKRDENISAVACSDTQEINSKANETQVQSSASFKSNFESRDERQDDDRPSVDIRQTHEMRTQVQSLCFNTILDDQNFSDSLVESNSSDHKRILEEFTSPMPVDVYEELTQKVSSHLKSSSLTNAMDESLGFSFHSNSVPNQNDTLDHSHGEKYFDLENNTESNTAVLSQPLCKPLNLKLNYSAVKNDESNLFSPTTDVPNEEEIPAHQISLKEPSCRSESNVERQGSPKEISVDVLHLSDATADVYDEDVCDHVNRASVRWSPSSSASDSDQSNKTSVLRSTSDVSATLSDEKERRRRDRKERPYKSDPFTGTVTRPPSLLSPDTPIQSCLSASTSCSFHSLDELDEPSDTNSLYDEEETQTRKRQNRISTASSASEDSGVSSHTWTDWKSTGGCVHCAAFSHHGASTPSSPSGSEFEALSSMPLSSQCNKCLMRQRERKETIQEMAETEKRYGRDLAILKDEFYRHMKSTSLLTLDQLDAIFMNLDELITVHKYFMGKLTSALVNSVREGDEGFSSVNVGGIFVESSKMFLAFEHYCVNQSQSSALLEQLEKEKELLKAFLQAAQNENAKMRRMHLKTFLMVPVQRVMKYPLLLGRLYRVTPCYHGDKSNIRQARDNIEDILEQINSKTKTSRPKNRSLQIQGYSLSEKIEVNRAALDMLGWSKKEVCDIITSRLWYGQVPDHTWASKRARNVKFSMVHAALLSHGRPTESPLSPRDPPRVLQVAMVLVKEKAGRYLTVREPLLMDRCVVTVDPEYDHVFEVHEQGKDTYLFKAETKRETNTWTGHLRQLSRHLGYWRRRRNGLPNVLLKTA